jgi:hypothetical protein
MNIQGLVCLVVWWFPNKYNDYHISIVVETIFVFNKIELYMMCYVELMYQCAMFKAGSHERNRF